jgi:hypothetical protein
MSSARRIIGGGLAIVAGFLILLSGFRTQSFLASTVPYFEQKLGSYIPYLAQVTIDAALLVLSFIIALGGLAVILGGVLILLKHLTTGKLLMALGGGVGFIGIAIALGYSIYTSGFGILVDHIDYWIGLAVASIARYVAK